MGSAISRRNLLLTGAAAAASGVAAPAFGQHHGHGALAQERKLSRSVAEATGDPLREPELRRSENGVLETTLRASYGPVEVDGAPAIARTFESSYPSPTLMARPGDTLRIKLVNDLDEPTNLHTHGLHVSPAGNADNVFVKIEPGRSFDYEIAIPEDHPSGTYWYHPHVHGSTYSHVAGGMAGALIVEGGLDDLDSLKGFTERLLVVQSAEFDANNTIVPVDIQEIHNQTKTINGQINPTITIRPGEVQRWRIVNATAESFLLLGLEGHPIHLISKDGNALTRPVRSDNLMVEPGCRADILVRGHQFSGSWEFRKMLWLGSDRQFEPDELLATLVVDGEPVTDHVIPETLIPLSEDLRDRPVDKAREIRFSVDRQPGGTRFLIDGQMVDMDRVDQTVQLGAHEEWIIYNDSPEWHPFHIHVNDFQVVAVNGKPVDEIVSWEDTRGLPPSGSITIRHRFLDYPGKFVFHCHLLFHEDNGMMGIVEVIA